MIDIAKKKLPTAAVLVLVYLSYCAMGWYSMRGVLAYYGQHYEWPSWLVNDVFAFFIGGIFPLLIYAFISRSTLRALQMRIGDGAKSFCYGIDLTVIAANVILFALKFMYIAIPLQTPVINIIIDPVVTIAAVALYFVYAFGQKYVDKPHFGFVMTNCMSMFLIVYGILAVINILTAVTA